MYIDKEAKKMYNILIKFIVRSSVLMACEKTVKKRLSQIAFRFAFLKREATKGRPSEPFGKRDPSPRSEKSTQAARLCAFACHMPFYAIN